MLLKSQLHSVSLRRIRAENLISKQPNEYVTQQMTEYRKQLMDMVSEFNSTKSDAQLSPLDAKEIKAIYSKIARRLHPDMSPVIQEHSEFAELWEQAP